MTKFYNLTKMLAATLFRKDSPIIPGGAIPQESEAGIILARLRALIEERRINEGENLLFDSFDIKQPVFLAIALDFYAHLSQLPESELEAADFSIEEIGEGISDALKAYKIKLTAKPAEGAPMKKVPVDEVLKKIKAAKEAQTAPSAASNVLADKPRSN